MCGIAGELRFRASETVADWEHLSRLMAQRGPDDAGLWAEDDFCTLAFRRLAILDLSPAGHQPMRDASGRYVLVMNGEVYNFRELRDPLTRKGVRFRSTGDAEVVLYALIHDGVKALDTFNGMFALAFYDTHSKRLLLARDHAGIKPLYYCHTPEGVVFASQYDQILNHPWAHSLAVSGDALALYLRQGYIPAPYALLESTAMLEPGAWLEISPEGQITQGRFFTFPQVQTPTLSGTEAIEAVDEALTRAVRRHLISDVPVGVFLSGGIDSPLVAAKIREEMSGPLKAFTMSVLGSPLDETSDARAYAQELGLTHITAPFNPSDAFTLLDDVIAASSEPFADYSIFPTLFISELSRREVTVMLSGDGGDELFWGYPTRFGSIIQAAPDFRQPHWWRSLRWALKKGLNVGQGYANLRWPTLGDWYRAKHSYLSEGALSRIFPTLPPWPADFALFDYDGSEPDEAAQWLRWNEFTGHLTRVLLKVDHASMAHALEVRVPLLDREVLSAAAQIDWRTCLDIDRGVGKLPLRQILSRHVHHQSRTKRGFAVPMAEWMRGPLRSLFEERVLNRPALMDLPLDRPALADFFTQHLEGQSDHAWGLWILLSLALWEDRHFVSRNTSQVAHRSDGK